MKAARVTSLCSAGRRAQGLQKYFPTSEAGVQRNRPRKGGRGAPTGAAGARPCEAGTGRDGLGQHSIPVLRRAPQGPQGQQERQGPRLPLQLCRAIPAEATPRGLQDAPGPAP